LTRSKDPFIVVSSAALNKYNLTNVKETSKKRGRTTATTDTTDTTKSRKKKRQPTTTATKQPITTNNKTIIPTPSYTTIASESVPATTILGRKSDRIADKDDVKYSK